MRSAAPTLSPTPPRWAWERYVAAITHADGRVSEEGMRALLDERDRDAPWPEALALGGLATVWARRGRTFEALVLFRHAARLCASLGDLEKATGAFGCHALCLGHLWPHADPAPALAELEALLARVPAGEATIARDAVDVLHAFLAVEAGDLVEARRRIEAHDGRPPVAGVDVVRKRFTSLTLRSRLAASQGDAVAADAALDEAAALGPVDLGVQLLLDWFRMHAARAAGDVATRLERARKAARAMRPAAPDDLHAGFRGVVASTVAAELSACGAPADEVLDAHDAAASAIVTRIAEIDDAVRALPALGLEDLDADDELAAHRAACAAEADAALRRVAAYVAERPDRLPAGFLDRVAAAGWAHVCAWCHRVRTEEGSWLPIGTFLRHARDVAMTHTICAPCAARAFGVTLRARA